MFRCLSLTWIAIATSLACVTAPKKLPGFDTVESEWDPLNERFGRLVVYAPDDVPWNPVVGRQAPTKSLRIDDHEIDLWERTFAYADLEPGRHTVSIGSADPLAVDVRPNAITWVEVEWGTSPEVVDESHARPRIADLRHTMPDTLPLNL